MSVEAVKKQILIALGALNVPLDRSPASAKIAEACSAAKLLRNRVLREHRRVIERVELLRQKTLYDEESDAEYDDESDAVTARGLESAGTARTEFIFMSEMQVAEKTIIPLLLAHGMNYSSNLLPQLLKLLTALLMSVPRFSAQETHQRDLLQRTKMRCGTDEFFSFLVQCVAPIAEKRSTGRLQREDVILLEIVLTLINHLLDGPPSDIEHVIGAFCRNHGIELLLVVINQNYLRTVRTSGEAVPGPRDQDSIDERKQEMEEAMEAAAGDNDVAENHVNAAAVEINGFSIIERGTGVGEICLNDSEEDVEEAEVDDEEEDEEDEEEEGDDVNNMKEALDRQLALRVHELLENDDQIWKWNIAAMTAIANVIKCASPIELAQLGFLSHNSAASPDQFLRAIRNGEQFRECKRASDSWRHIAKSRNGAVSSNGILIRDQGQAGGITVGGRAIGTVSSLLGTQRKDPLEAVKDIDLRKRGRFIKGMFQDSAPRCGLPLPTKLQLSQQGQSFMCYGFEPLSSMTWNRLLQVVVDIQRAANEFKEMVAGYRHSGDTMELTSVFDTALYQSLNDVLHYISICGALLHYIREMARLMLEERVPLTTASFQQQWHSVSSVISLEHLEAGFSMLRSFLQCRDLRRRADITVVVSYLAEILLVLNLLLEGEIIRDSSVKVAAHALASSALYKEENIKTVFDLLSEYSGKPNASRTVQVITLLTAAAFQLMEKCSYKGSLLLPKRAKRQTAVATEAVPNGEDDKDSINSEALEEMVEELASDTAGMIDDGDESCTSSQAKEGVGLMPSSELIAAGDTTTGDPADAPASETGLPTASAIDVTETAEEAELAISRAPSEVHPPSIASVASSGHTAFSQISSEREVAVSSYLRRLATPKNVALLCATLRHWRVNDADVNLALTYLMESLVKDGCEGVFFNVAFLLLFREVLVHGGRTHAPLHHLCDRIVFDFFNPPFSKAQDARVPEYLGVTAVSTLSGAQSFLGFEVALRCGRALFNLGATDYSLLEEKAMPHMRDSVAIPLPGENEESIGEQGGASGWAPEDAQTAEKEDEEPPRRKRYRHEKKVEVQVPAAPETEVPSDGNTMVAL